MAGPISDRTTETVQSAELSSTRRLVIVCALHFLQALSLAWFATHANFCCDATLYYLPAGRSLWHDGLLWDDDYSGYRFYFAPLILGFLQQILGLFSSEPAQVTGWMPYALAATCFSTSLFASVYILRAESFRNWWLFAVPILFNPYLLAMSVYPLQESVVVVVCMPLLFVLLATTRLRATGICVVGAALVGSMFATRSSLSWFALPALFFVVQKSRLLTARPRSAFRAAGCGLLIFLAFAAPQSYIAWNHDHTLNLFTHTHVAEEQAVFGVEMLDYSTMYDRDGFHRLPIWSPFRELPVAEKSIHFYPAHPQQGLFMALTHIWSGLHYVVAAPYASKSDYQIVTGWLIFSAIVVALGIAALLFLFDDPLRRSLIGFLAGTLVLSCLYTALTATEARFGLLGFVASSIAAWHFVVEQPRLTIRTIPLVIAYVLLCIIINALLLYRVPLLWPNTVGLTPAAQHLSICRKKIPPELVEILHMQTEDNV